MYSVAFFNKRQKNQILIKHLIYIKDAAQNI